MSAEAYEQLKIGYYGISSEEARDEYCSFLLTMEAVIFKPSLMVVKAIE